jgi:hypothetical protein
MSKSQKKRKTPKHVLALPDLELGKSAVLNTYLGPFFDVCGPGLTYRKRY